MPRSIAKLANRRLTRRVNYRSTRSKMLRSTITTRNSRSLSVRRKLNTPTRQIQYSKPQRVLSSPSRRTQHVSSRMNKLKRGNHTIHSAHVASSPVESDCMDDSTLYFEPKFWGFGSQYYTLFLSMIIAKKYNKMMLINENGGLVDNLISSVFNIGYPHRYTSKLNRKSAFTVFMEKVKFGKNTEIGSFRNARTHLSWPEQHQFIQKTISFKPDVVSSIEKQNMAEFSTKKFDFGMHIRRGDKSVETRLLTVQEYTNGFDRLLKTTPWTSDSTLYIATDDYLFSSQIIDYVTKKYGIKICIRSANLGRNGHNYYSFNNQHISKKKEELYNFIHDVYNLSRCNYAIVTFSSNIGLMVSLLNPGNEKGDRVISLDSPIPLLLQ